MKSRNRHAGLTNPRYVTYLPLEYHQALKALATRRAKPETAVVREAIRQYIMSELGIATEAPAAAAEVEANEAAARSDRFDRERARILAERQAYWKQQEPVRKPGIWQRLRGK
jgi:predicted DNA-binding protein